MGAETSTGGTAGRFRSTVWEVVRQAQEGAPDALDQLMADCWKPIYFFIRRRGHDVEQATDLTQAFMGHFLEKGLLSRVAPSGGRFRSFVMATLDHFLMNQHTRNRALKRGAGMNFVAAEEDLAGVTGTPEKAFFRGWA